MRLRVYIAGPISRGDLAHNINQATETFVSLAKAGFAPMCPHWSVYAKPARVEYFPGIETPDLRAELVCTATVQGNDQMTHEDWMGVDLPWVMASDALIRLPGESKGADTEVDLAEQLGIPVFYSVHDLCVWARQSELERLAS